MRPLNRPMFKYGGPIKEGIMDGMREPKKNGGRMLLAGEHPQQFKDASGREQHFAPLVYGGMLLANAARAAPLVYRGFKAARTFAPGNLGTKGRLKDIFFGQGRFRQGQIPSQGNMLSDAQIAAGMKPTIGKRGILESLKDPKSLGAAMREYPITTLSLPSLATTAVTGGGPLLMEGAKGFANFLVPGQRFDPFGPKKDLKTTEDDGSGIKRGGKGKIVATDETGTGGKGDSKSDEEKQQINEARIKDTKEKYYKLMGIDKLKKDAVYDSLINASKIVQEEGADLKGAIRSGNLQNRIIQAISQNLDKSAELKKSIDAAVLKGEIEKDINLTKPSAFAEQVDYIRKNPNDPLAKKLSGMTSVADNIAALSDKPITSDMVSRLIDAKGTDVAGIIKDDKYQKWEKSNENKDEIDYLQDVYKGQKLDAGIYVINKKAIKVDTDGVAFEVDLDSIIG